MGRLNDKQSVCVVALGALFVRCLCYSEEQECMNIWTAYLNFENLYGTQSQVDEVLRQAQLKVDPVAIQRRLCDIYARSEKLDVSEWQSLLHVTDHCYYSRRATAVV